MSKEYVNKLSSTQKNNIGIILLEAKAQGVTNKHTLEAMLAIFSKESNFIPINENLNYSAKRIMEVWPKIGLAKANELAGKPELLGNFMYGGRYGNSSNEGYKFRGRGFVQLTFKDNYKSIGKLIGVDLVSNPDLLLDPKIAAKASVAYYIREFKTAEKKGYLKSYNARNINDFKNNTDSLNAMFQATRGWGNKGPDTTGGYKKAKERIDYLAKFTDFVSENKGAIGAGFFLEQQP